MAEDTRGNTIELIPQLRTTRLDESIHFYVSKLGFDLEFKYSDFYAGIKVGDGQRFHLKLVDSPDPSIDVVSKDNHLHLFFSVEDVGLWAEKCRSAGVSFVRDPAVTDWGTREFYVVDNEGHTLCFSQGAD